MNWLNTVSGIALICVALATAPAAVADLAARDATETTIEVVFTAPIGSVSYQYSLNGGAWTSLTVSFAGSLAFGTVTGLTTGTTYTLKTRGVNAAGSGPDSNQITQATVGAKAGAGVITTAAAGNWSNTATWTGGVVPTYGKSVTMNHNVTVDGPVTIGSASAATVAAEILVSTGITLTVAANRCFRARGNVTLAGSGKIVQNAGAIFEFDASLATSPASQNYRVAIGNAHNNTPLWQIVGGATNRALVRSNAGGGNGFSNGLPATDVSGPYLQSGMCDWLNVDVLRMGTAAINAVTANPSNGVSHSLVSVIFDTCGQMGQDFNLGTTSNYTLNNVKQLNTLATASLRISGNGYVSGVRSLNNCVFDKLVEFFSPEGVSVTNSYFHARIDTTPQNFVLWQNNFVRSTDAANTSNFYGVIQDSFFFYDEPATANPHFIQMLSNAVPSGTQAARGLQFYFNGPDGGSDRGDCISVGLPSTAKALEISRCIVLRGNGRVDSAGTLVSALGNANCTLTIEHNTFCSGQGTGSGGVGGAFGETYVGHAGMVASFKSNIAYSTVAGTARKAYDSPTNNNIPDMVSAANANFNCGFNLKTTNNGKGYEDLEFSSGSPGANDVDVDPQFVAEGRNPITWDTSLGGAGTTASVLSRIQNDTSQIVTLMNYIKAGLTPQASTIQTAAHDGGRIGAV